MSEQTNTKRVPVKRWLVLGLIVLGAYAAFMGPTILRPISPVVVLPPEPIATGSPITNTMLATLLADALALAMGFGAWRFMRSGKEVPSGFYNFFEMLLEFLYNSVEAVTGKWAKRVFPVVATIFLLVFTANVTKLAPGYESIGFLHEAHKDPAYGVKPLFTLGSFTLYTLDKGDLVKVAAHGEETPVAEAHTAEAGEAPCHACEVIPFLRGPATDLNFPLALAVIAVVMTQVYGLWALGPAYLGKFFQFKALVSGGIFGMINFGVGILELLLEFAKVLSFSFRLFGNIFAGTLLLSIVGALTAVAVPPFLYLFEIFFGIIQAYVFFLLATMFISMGLISHHADEHGEQHVETAA